VVIGKQRIDVETAAQVAFLRAEKWEELQGLSLCQAAAGADFEAYLRANCSHACDKDPMRGLDQVSDEIGIARLA
jgi:hypothetical protein